jgi:hypothetical protein
MGPSERDKLIHEIAEGAGVTSGRFLLVSADACLTCLDDKMKVVVEYLDDRLDLVVLGADSSEVKILNAIYRRWQLKFSHASPEAWQELVKIDKKFSMGVFLGARRDRASNLLTYDGFDIPAPRRIEAVLEFIQN